MVLEPDKAPADREADDALATDADERLTEALLSAPLEDPDPVADDETGALLAGALEETPDDDTDELAPEVVLWGLSIPASPSSDVLVADAELEPEFKPEAETDLEPETKADSTDEAAEVPELADSDEAVEEAIPELPPLVVEAGAEVIVVDPAAEEEADLELLSCSLKPGQGLIHGGRLLLLTLLLAEADPAELDEVSANEYPTPLELVVDRLCVEKPPCTGVLIGDCVVPNDVASSDDVDETEPNGTVDCTVEVVSVLVLSLLRVCSSNPADSDSYSLRDTNCDLLDSDTVLAGPLETPGLVERAKIKCC